jgi:transposase
MSLLQKRRAGSVRGVYDPWGMSYLACDRDQGFLLPPSLRDWLPADHLAWFLLDVVGRFDLSGFGEERSGPGRPGYDPAMMVALFLYAYANGVLSSRAIERRCREDVAFRVICANRVPDHTTVSRFRAGHEGALAGLFCEVLALCAKAGMVKVGLVAVDGSKVRANAALKANRTYPAIRAEVDRWLAEAAAADEAEDREFGQRRGDELPEELADPASRQARLERAAAELEAEQRARQEAYQAAVKRRAEHRARTGGGLPGPKPTPPDPGLLAASKRNITDPESRVMSARGSLIQAYNAQAVVTEGQIIVAAEVINAPNDSQQLVPMLRAARANLKGVGDQRAIKCMLADSGYENCAQVREARETGVIVVSPPRPHPRRRVPHPEVQRMTRILDSRAGKRLYRRRAALVEPVFAQTKHHRGASQFSRRGLGAVDSEWKFLAAVHNLLKLYRCQPQGA